MNPVLHNSTKSTGAAAIASWDRRIEISIKGLGRKRGSTAYTIFQPVPLSLLARSVLWYGRTRICSGSIAAMKLIAVYVVFVLLGEGIAYVVGRSVEQMSPSASLPVFLACFFFVFWAAWRLAIRVT